MPVNLIYVMLILALVGTIGFNIAREEKSMNEKLRAIAGDNPSARTRRLLGERAYSRMVENVDSVIRTHRDDEFSIVSLTSGAETGEGGRRLHELLPGDALFLHRADSDDLRSVDVYSEGRRVGRLLLDDALQTEDLMENKSVTGIYVAEQNSFGACDHARLSLIIFYTDRGPGDFTQPRTQDGHEFMALSEGPHPLYLYSN